MSKWQPGSSVGNTGAAGGSSTAYLSNMSTGGASPSYAAALALKAADANSDRNQWELWIGFEGFFKTVIEFINGLNKPVFAVDIPSGLNSDTGQVCGACIRAIATSTFAFAKTGHLIHPGTQYTGALDIVDIGIPAPIVEEVYARIAEAADPGIFLHLRDMEFSPQLASTAAMNSAGK